MSSNVELQKRIEQLLQTADATAKEGDLQRAYEALKEASHLDPKDPRVGVAIKDLQAGEQTGNLKRLLSNYLADGPELDGQKAVQAVRQQDLPEAEAKNVLDILLKFDGQKDLLDSLTGTLLQKSKYARKEVASQIKPPFSLLFEQLYARGDESFKAFATLPLDESLWSSKIEQKTAQADIFRLCIAKLIDANIEHPQRLMHIVARQLTSAPENVVDIIDDDIFEVILSCLDIRLSAGLRSQTMLATSKALEITEEKGEKSFGQFLATKVAKSTIDDLITAFSAAAAIFPMVPTIAANLFLTDGFVQQLVPNLEKNSKAATDGKRTLEQAALELLSAACVDKSCREAIDRYCSPWLQDLTDERDGKHKALAALVLAKINSESQEDITSKLADLVLVGDADREQAVEGLAYTSLQPKIKEEIISNERLLKRVVEALNERPSAAFGCLTVFSNLCAYRPPRTAEQKKMAQLKAYANSQKPEPEDPLDDDSHVTARARKLLDVDVIPAIVGSCKQTTSPTNIALVARTLLALAKEQKHRTKMAQQGALKLLLQIRDRISKTDKSTGEAAIIERNTSHALARLLISVNPNHVFSASLPAPSAVTALVPLLSIDEESEQRDLLPTFESLLALTNLASMEDNSIRDLMIRNAWDRLEDLLFSSKTLVQRASVELVCNLVVSPSGVAKFADGSNDAKRRMQILLALADVEDFATRRAAGGALAMLTEWDSSVTAVLDKEMGVRIILSMCEDESDEMKHRGFASVLNLISAPGDVGLRGVKAVKDEDGKEVLAEALRKSKDPQILTLGVEALKKLQ